ncbi:MAG: S8 family serine peptidase, partial [Acidimicrobiales bacterium]
MTRRRRAMIAVAAVALLAPLTAATPAGASGPVRPGGAGGSGYRTVVVQMSSPSVHAASVLAGVPGSHPVAAPGRRYLLRVPAGDVPVILSRLRSEHGVSYASVARLVHAMAVSPDDPCYVAACPTDSGTVPYPAQAYLQTIGAPAAWAVTHGDGIRVAVFDSGVDASQPDLAGKIVGLTNVCSDDDTACDDPSGGQVASDQFGHGTMVTGIVGADTDNGIGVASLGWGVDVDEYKVLDSQGNGNTADVATAIYDAVAAGDRVINMSLACSYYDPTTGAYDPSLCQPDPDEEAAVEYALAHDVVVVAAAGNDGLDQPTWPASYPGVLSVAATDDSGVVQDFSQWGSAANIAAPGVGIVSTWLDDCDLPNGCYNVADGTSMAAPQVAAAAALMISHDPSLSGPQVTALLESTARPTSGGNPIAGGVLDVPAALAAEANPPTSYNGYDLAGADGSVYSFGGTVYLGDLAGHPLNKAVVGMALRGDGLGYWLDARDGGVFSFGDAGFYGSIGCKLLNKPVVGMAATPDGKGYWLV